MALGQIVPKPQKSSEGRFARVYGARYLASRISHSPPAAIAYLVPSPGLVLIADFDPPSAELHPVHCNNSRICHNLRDFWADFSCFHLSPGSTNDPLGGSLDRVAPKFVRNPG
jgi:hypothetical protein